MTKLLNLIFLMIIIFEEIKSSHGEKLNCQFNDGVVTPSVTGYHCYVTSLDISNKEIIIDGFTGTHLANKNDNFVIAIYIYGTKTKYIPENLGLLFHQLTAFIMYKTKLIEIKSKDFLGIQKLEYLFLAANQLSSIASDAFTTLTKLKYINLNYNQIQEIQNGLFDNNLILEEISLYNNKIKFIGSELLDKLPKSNEVDLDDNICLQKRYQGSTEIDQLKIDMIVKCFNRNEIPATTSTTTTTQNPLEIKIKEFGENDLFKAKKKHQTELKKLSDDKQKMQDALSKAKSLQQNNEKATMELTKEKEVLQKELLDAKNVQKSDQITINELQIEMKKVLIEKETIQNERLEVKEAQIKQLNNLDEVQKILSKALDDLKNKEILINEQQKEINKLKTELFQAKDKQERLRLGNDKFMNATSNLEREINELKAKNEHQMDLKDMNKMMKQLLKASNKQQMQCNENIKRRDEISKVKYELKSNEIAMDKMKVELLEAKDKINIIEHCKETITNMTRLTNCNTFNINCIFNDTNGAYSCETRDLFINQKDMEVNEVTGTHLKSQTVEDVIELIITDSTVSVWSNEIFKTFPALQTLRIINAKLIQLSKDDFNSASKLTVLIVNGNNIELLGDDVFHGVDDDLETIDMGSNQIKQISLGTFHGLKQLKFISLKDNLIIELQLETFKDAVRLETLILSGNKIKFLDGEIFQSNTRLMTLAVDHNELREVGEDILNYSVMLKNVDFNGNDCVYGDFKMN